MKVVITTGGGEALAVTDLDFREFNEVLWDNHESWTSNQKCKVEFGYGESKTTVAFASAVDLDEIVGWVEGLVPREKGVLLREYKDLKKSYDPMDTYFDLTFDLSSPRPLIVRSLIAGLKPTRSKQWRNIRFACKAFGKSIATRDFLSANKLEIVE